MTEFNVFANSSGLQSIDLGDDIDYDFVMSENSDTEWEYEHLEEASNIICLAVNL